MDTWKSFHWRAFKLTAIEKNGVTLYRKKAFWGRSILTYVKSQKNNKSMMVPNPPTTWAILLYLLLVKLVSDSKLEFELVKFRKLLTILPALICKLA